MKKPNSSEDRLKEALSQMPKIHDHQDKDVLFQRISSKRRQVQGRQKKKRVAIMPVLASVMALGLVLILVPLILNEGVLQQNAGEEKANHALDRAKTSKEESGSRETDQESGMSKDSAEKEITGETYSQLDKVPESLVIHSKDTERPIVHGAVADLQRQYVIPLTLVVPAAVDKNDFLNKLGQYVQEDRWGTSNYVFNNTSFQLDETNQQVVADFPDTFPIAEQGSNGPYMLERLLTSMFRPYQVEKVVFTEKITIGKIGTVKELPLRHRKMVYKSYQSDEGNRSFLIEVPMNEQADFTAAITEMKKDEKGFHVSGTVPEAADLSVTVEGEELRISFDTEEPVPHGQELVTMIDAILMTAKNFGYEQVFFPNAGQEQAGPYDLTKPINVPRGANPISPSS
ncbi:hypothetical protein EU245_05920 [Lentibacillus lipolyticus]|nr:hypothetical protein EU245_05920 [Lentibacillus lipolyticus]